MKKTEYQKKVSRMRKLENKLNPDKKDKPRKKESK